jgi:hypothetical protein
MSPKTIACLLAASLLSLLLLPGCAGYGKTRYLPSEKGQETLNVLLEAFQDFHVYYTGLSQAYPSGLIFDPKQDTRSIAQKKWIKVKSPETARKLVKKLKRYQNYPPRLYALHGEEGEKYGYIYTGYPHVSIRQLQKDRIHVLEMFEPPHLKFDPNGPAYDPS